MHLSKITNLNMLKLSNASPSPLRPGQIIQGEVLKIYPENKAEILLGGNRFIANLEVGLELGGRYHFQVAANANYLQLRVLGELLKRRETVHLSRLLKSLGIKDSKQNLQLIHMLTSASIPFDKSELQSAIKLLKGEKNKELAITVLVGMIANKLPLSSTVFQSLTASKMFTISEQLKSVLEQLSPNINTAHSDTAKSNKQLKQQLDTSIRKLVEQPASFRDLLSEEIAIHNKNNNQTIFRTLQGLGFIQIETDFTEWVQEWKNFNENHTAENQFPYSLNEIELFQLLERINSNRGEFIRVIRNFFSQWEPRLKQQEAAVGSLSPVSLTALRTEMKANIFPFLPQNQQQLLETLFSSEQNVLTIYRGLQTLYSNENQSLLLNLANKVTEQGRFHELSSKEKFLEHIRQSITMLGYDYEHRLATEKELSILPQTVKGILLQLLGIQGKIKSEQHTKLLSLIQGLQLQSVNETQTLVQAALQLPAERLGLLNDLTLEFEGKKNEKGEINPDYCRIIFYLELSRLKETVIDVNIQQRSIAITVFNNTQGLPVYSKLYKEKLEKSLESLDYRLSSMKFKKLEEKVKQPQHQESNRIEESQGVDYRI